MMQFLLHFFEMSGKCVACTSSENDDGGIEHVNEIGAHPRYLPIDVFVHEGADFAFQIVGRILRFLAAFAHGRS